ncbi:MAG: hypothetical protein K1X31_09330 [Gemmatimonadaceae bacterium]|nr:hypothetical protein [Gemmatimonadaceae bacterium]
MPRRPFLRLSAFIAAIALLSAVVRPALACEMGHEGHGDAPATVQHATVQHATVQHATVQHATVQHATVQHATVQDETVHHAPRPDHRPACDHVVGCAVMLGATDAPPVPRAVAAPATPSLIARAVDAPARPVDPPPPRA